MTSILDLVFTSVIKRLANLSCNKYEGMPLNKEWFKVYLEFYNKELRKGNLLFLNMDTNHHDVLFLIAAPTPMTKVLIL